MRLYQPIYNDFIKTLGLSEGTTILQMQFLCELYGRLSEFEKMEALLAKLEGDIEKGDNATKPQIFDAVSAASRWCYLTGVFESSWQLVSWLIQCFWQLAALTWRIQALKDAEFVAGKAGSHEEIPDLIELRELLELVLKTRNDMASIEVPKEQLENLGRTALTAEQRNSHFKVMGQIFSKPK
jgi:hypothetical protein